MKTYSFVILLLVTQKRLWLTLLLAALQFHRHLTSWFAHVTYLLQKLAGKLYEAAQDGDVDAHHVFEVLGVKREVALASVDPVPVPAPQVTPSTVSGTVATAAPSFGNFFHIRLLNLDFVKMRL